jgi:hypothetical protein
MRTCTTTRTVKIFIPLNSMKDIILVTAGDEDIERDLQNDDTMEMTDEKERNKGDRQKHF